MNGLDPTALDFSELMPLLQIHDPERAAPINEMPNEQLLELMQALDAELEKHRGSQKHAAGQVNGETDVDDSVGQDPTSVSESATCSKSQSSTRVRTYTARKV